MPKHLVVIITLSVLLASNIFCKNNAYYLEIEFPSYPKKQISIGSYYGKNLLLEADINLDSKGRGSYKNIVHNGLYVLLLSDSSSYEFMVTEPGEYKIYMVEHKIKISSNPASEVYSQFFNFTAETKFKLDLLNKKMSLSTHKEKKLLDLRIKQTRNALDSITRNIALEFEGNLVSDYCNALLPVKIPESVSGDNDSLSWYESIIYYQNHYLDNINWNNQDLIYTQILEEKILTYIERIVPQKPVGITRAIDTLFSIIKGDEMMKYMANTLLNNFQQNIKNPLSEYAFVYLVSNYIMKNKISDVSPKLKIQLTNKSDQIKPSMIGEKATVFSLHDENGNLFTLNKYNSSLTVLLFWDYSCTSCMRIMQNFRKVLNKYSQENVQVVTVFIGQDEAIWQAWVHEYLHKNWANTILGAKTELLKIYNITHTPTIYLLDSELTIVDKNITVHELEKVLEKSVKAKN